MKGRKSAKLVKILRDPEARGELRRVIRRGGGTIKVDGQAVRVSTIFSEQSDPVAGNVERADSKINAVGDVSAEWKHRER